MIANTFIKRPVTAIVISIVLVLTGTICIFNLPIDQYPDITPPIVQVNGQFTGADAQTVEESVARPCKYCPAAAAVCCKPPRPHSARAQSQHADDGCGLRAQ